MLGYPKSRTVNLKMHSVCARHAWVRTCLAHTLRGRLAMVPRTFCRSAERVRRSVYVELSVTTEQMWAGGAISSSQPRPYLSTVLNHEWSTLIPVSKLRLEVFCRNLLSSTVCRAAYRSGHINLNNQAYVITIIVMVLLRVSKNDGII